LIPALDPQEMGSCAALDASASYDMAWTCMLTLKHKRKHLVTTKNILFPAESVQHFLLFGIGMHLVEVNAETL